MPHVYDSGQATPQRTAIRSAVVQRLALLARPNLYVRSVRAIAVPLAGADITPEVLQTLQGNHPAILVALGNGAVTAGGMPAVRSRIAIDVHVYVVTGHGRDLVTGRLAGDVRSTDVTLDPGIDTMLEHVEELLAGWDMGIPGVEEMRLEAEEELYTETDLTVWEVSFSVRVDRTARTHPLITTLVQSIASAHHLADADVPATPVVSTVTNTEAP